MNWIIWTQFFIAAWLISASPGPGAVATISSGLNYGFYWGMYTTIGLILGIWTQIAVIAFGLGSIITQNPLLFQIIKWTGILYLTYLGIKSWLSRQALFSHDPKEAVSVFSSGWKLVYNGWCINSLNPKGTVFLLAIVPSFLDFTQPLPMQYLVIAITLSFTDLVVMATYTFFSSQALKLLQSERNLKLLNRLIGGFFIAWAGWTAYQTV
ncbi:MAG: LysE family transporter [Gammaproteobacteria bacterium]|nr:LysE family transporter [Gammaproteobacteria bacterium]